MHHHPLLPLPLHHHRRHHHHHQHRHRLLFLPLAGTTRVDVMAFSADSGAPQPGAFICVMADGHIFRINRCGALQPAAVACSSGRWFGPTAWLALAALFSLRLREPCDRGRRERWTARLSNKQNHHYATIFARQIRVTPAEESWPPFRAAPVEVHRKKGSAQMLRQEEKRLQRGACALRGSVAVWWGGHDCRLFNRRPS